MLPWSTPSSRRLIVSSSVRNSSATVSVGGPCAQPVAAPAGRDVVRGRRGDARGGSDATRQLRSKTSFGFGDTQFAGTVARIRWITWSAVMSRASAS